MRARKALSIAERDHEESRRALRAAIDAVQPALIDMSPYTDAEMREGLE